MTDTPTTNQPRILVETCLDLPEDDDSWTPCYYLRFTGGSEPMSQLIGEIYLEQPYGLLLQEYTPRVYIFGVTPDLRKTGTGSLIGQLVRLLVEDPDGTIHRGTGVQASTYTARWWGRIIECTTSPDGATAPLTGGHVEWRAVGMMSLLDQVVLRNCPVVTSAGNSVYAGRFPDLNALPGGDRSTATFTINGQIVYLPDLVNTTSGNLWTGAQAAALVLAVVRDAIFTSSGGPSGIEWQISDPDGCLNYLTPRLSLQGLTAAQAINLIASPQRGLVTWQTVTGTVVTIHVRSTVRTAIVVPSYTLPASTKTVTLDQAAAYYIRDVRGRENQESTYDVIEVRGARPWVGITLGFSLSDSSLALRKGWTAGLESGWNARPNFSIYQNVWRRFEVRPDWDGSQYNNPSTGLRNAFLRSHGSNDPAYGQAGLTGERVFGVTGAGYEVPTNLLTAEAELPCSVGFSTLRIGPRQRAVVVMGAGSGWYDFSTWSVSIQSSPLAVLIDDGQDGRLLQGFLEAGQTLLVTIGMREISDLAVSWQRPVTDWPGPVPRTKLIEDSGYDQWIALAGCVTGTSIDGTTLTTLASDVTVRDDVAQMRAHLALKRPWFAQPDWYYSWRFVGLADFTDDYRSGTLLTEVNRGDRTDQTNVIIAPRRWGTERIDDILIYTTYFATERILPSINMTL